MLASFESKTIDIGARLRPPADAERRASRIPATVDVAVVGAGIIGLSIGWRLAARGLSVAVFDRAEAGTGTTLASTGMLAAAAEHEAGGDDLLALALDSQARWHPYREALEADSGMKIDYRGEGTMLVALARDEVERLRFRFEIQKRANLDARWLGGVEARALEPGLRGPVAAGIFCSSDHQVDPRLVSAALKRAFLARGGLLFENVEVVSIDREAGRARGIVCAAGACRATTTIVATGVWSGETLAPLGIDIPIRPLKGQALALKTSRQTGNLTRVVWTEQIHMSPKSDGRLIVGATMEDTGFNAAITVGGALALLEGVHRALPSSEEMEIEAIWSGYRPTSDDDAPILGETGVPGLLLATGHHRNGILLAPATAAALEELVVNGAMSGSASRFGLARFAKRPAHAGVAT